MIRSKSEIIRRLRLGNLRSLLRARCGHTLPDDDAGREYLWEFLLPISLGPEAGRKMQNAIETWAPWMDADEARQTIDQITRAPTSQRKPPARTAGRRLRVTNAERERLRLWTIAPVDMTAKQLAEQYKAKDRAKKHRRRLAAGSRPREAYLAANSITREKPWKKYGICRRTWERRRRTKVRDAGPSEVQGAPCRKSVRTKASYRTGHTCDTEKSERP